MNRPSRHQGKSFREECIRIHGNRCMNCRTDENIEWHHIVAMSLGGNDIPYNVVPLCRACHDTVHSGELLLKTFQKSYIPHNGGRKTVYPENCDAIFDDYAHCRISRDEAAERLNKPDGHHWVEMYAYKEWLKEKNISQVKNRLLLITQSGKAVKIGQEVGCIKYKDGTVEKCYWKEEEPLTGESNIPTAVSIVKDLQENSHSVD